MLSVYSNFFFGLCGSFQLAAGVRFGFGVEGDWQSEYVPKEDAEFYWTKNGVKVGKLRK